MKQANANEPKKTNETNYHRRQGSFGFFSFLRGRPVGLWIHSNSFATFVRSPGVVGLIRFVLENSGAPAGS